MRCRIRFAADEVLLWLFEPFTASMLFLLGGVCLGGMILPSPFEWTTPETVLYTVAARFSCLMCLLFVTRQIASGGTAPNQVNMAGKMVIITGANSGCGYEAALQLAQMGAHVILACRNADRGTAAVEAIQGRIQPPGRVEYCQLDLADLESVKMFAHGFLSRPGVRLDVLINNAGIMWAPYDQSRQGHEMHFAVNHLGHFLLTLHLLPLLTENKGRVLNIGSVSMMTTINKRLEMEAFSMKYYNPGRVYASSKLANALFTTELARRCEVAGNGVRTVLVHPGISTTSLARHAPIFARLCCQCMCRWFRKRPHVAAWTTVHCATTPALQQGALYMDCEVRPLPDYACDRTEAEKLWILSEELVTPYL